MSLHGDTDVSPIDVDGHEEAPPSVQSEAQAPINRYRRFRFKLCACCVDCTLTAEAVLCTSCQASRQWMALHNISYKFDCFACVMLGLALPCAPAIIRRKVATRFLIDETLPASLVQGLLCPLCTLCQMNRELAFQGLPPGATIGALVPITEQMA